MNIFISKVDLNKTFANELYGFLKEHEYDTDTAIIWGNARDYLRGADVIIGVLSQVALTEEGKTIRSHWNWALLNERRFVFVQVEPVDVLSHVFVNVRRFEYWVDKERAFQDLLAHLAQTTYDFEKFTYTRTLHP